MPVRVTFTFKVRTTCRVRHTLVRVRDRVMVNGYMLSKVESGIVLGWI